jgi:hypothetical protein
MPSPNLNSEDYYQILGVARNADDAELKKAYRKLAVKASRSQNYVNSIAMPFFFKSLTLFVSIAPSSVIVAPRQKSRQ